MNHVYDKFFIGGDWVAPHGTEVIDVVSARTEEVIGRVPAASGPDVDAAVDAARRAFDDPEGWSTWDPERRAEVLTRFATALDKRAEDMARIVTEQNGMPTIIAAQSEAVTPQLLLRYYAELSQEQMGEEARPSITGGTTLVRRLPVGVVAAIVPWNFPQTLTFFKLAPALAAGNTVVLKPAPETVLDTYIVAEAAIDAGLPPGVLNIVPGGQETGAALVSHPHVDKVAFTGSTTAGRSIAEECGRMLRPVTLELGGKSAAIVLDDADLTGAMEKLFLCTLVNSGQTCMLGTRVLAPRARYHEVVDTFAGLASALKIGDPTDPETMLGPLVSRRQRDRVERYIAKGRDEGRLVVGGGRPRGLDRGWYVSPTVFADVDNAATIAREEIFGPVLAVIPYDDDDEAVRIANDSEYGLGGSVWSADEERALAVAKKVQTGTIGVNGYNIDFHNPFGGVKSSGIGRELGPEGLAGFQQLQSVYLG